VGLNSLKSLNLTNVYPNNKNKKKKKNKKKNNNNVKSKPLELRSRVKMRNCRSFGGMCAHHADGLVDPKVLAQKRFLILNTPEHVNVE
jgi:hypothetical protein